MFDAEFVAFPVANAELYYHIETQNLPEYYILSDDDVSDNADTASNFSVCDDPLYENLSQNATGFDINIDTFSELDDNSEDEEMDEMEEEFPDSDPVSDKFYYPRFNDSTRIQPLCYATALDLVEPFEHWQFDRYCAADMEE